MLLKQQKWEIKRNADNYSWNDRKQSEKISLIRDGEPFQVIKKMNQMKKRRKIKTK